jgi:cytochrome c oxidase subunit 2
MSPDAFKTFMPPEGTAIAPQVDAIYGALIVLSFIAFVGMMGGMCYFVWKYRRRSGADKTAYITHDHTLEFLWSFIPAVIFFAAFGWGWHVYMQLRTMPENGLEIQVVGKKWDWRFIYKNGKEVTSGLDSNNQKVAATMVVPVGRPVKLIMTSEKISQASTDQTDRAVIHSFYIPAFRIKQDVVPGRFTAEWFQAEKIGTYQVFCAEYCGEGHWAMQGHIKVVSQEDFEKWLSAEGNGQLSLADRGKELFAAKACIGCHSLDGSRLVGPSYKGLFGSMVELESGGPVKADEDYIRESILEPNAKIVKTFPAGVMPTFAGQLNDDDVKALIEFIKSVK